MRYELFLILKWSFHKKNFINFAKWVIKKIIKKLIFQIKVNSHKKYPRNIYNLIKNKNIESNNNFIFGVKEDLIIKKNYKKKKIINLIFASKSIIIKNSDNINWQTKFSDPEDQESLHRWNWLLYIISKNNYKGEHDDWLLNQIYNWIKNFNTSQNKIFFKTNYIWHSYNVSERISNLIIFLLKRNISLNDTLIRFLYNHTKYLINNLEYKNNFTNNHIINNARAIIFAGFLLKEGFFITIGKNIIRSFLPKLFSKDGFSREGSSHYQFIITRWIIEILFILEFNQKKNFSYFIKRIAKHALVKCNFFTIKNKKKHQLVNFGDISPDFKPEWLINLANINNKTINYIKSNWINLWDKKKINLLRFFNVKKTNVNLKSNNSEWFKIKLKKHLFFLRAKKLFRNNFITHEHSDFGHFYYFYNNKPILIDLNRINYQNNFGISAMAHNSIQINNYDPVPNNQLEYPKNYINFINKVFVKRRNHRSVQIDLINYGFKRVIRDLIWKRTLILDGDDIIVRDKIEGESFINLKIFFHFDSNLKVQSQSGQILVKTNDDKFIFENILPNGLKILKDLKSHSYFGKKIYSYGRYKSCHSFIFEDNVKLPYVSEFLMRKI